MSVYCALKCSHSIEPRHLHCYQVQLTLKNPNEQSEKMAWKVTLPLGIPPVTPHGPLEGSATLPPGTEEVIASWRFDVLKIPDKNRSAIMEQGIMRVAVVLQGMNDSCETKTRAGSGGI